MRWKNCFSLHRRKAALGFLFAAMTLFGTLYYNARNIPLLLMGAGLSAVFVLLGALRFPAEGRFAKHLTVLWYIFAIFATVIAIQTATSSGFWNLGLKGLLLNAGCVALVFAAFLALTGRFRLSFHLASLFLFLLTLIDYTVYCFRGSIFTPVDILAAGAAFNVAHNYRIYISASFFLGLVLWTMLLFSGFCLPPREAARKGRTRLIGLIALVALSAYWYAGCSHVHITAMQRMGTRRHGLLAHFSAQILDTVKSKKPDGYSVERVQALENAYRDAPDAATNAVGEASPDIIVIMNESFADLSVWGSELNAEAEILPFFNSLRENTIRGNALVSIYGGGTVHSEYAFLSGNLLENLQQRIVPYMLYVNSPSYSLASALRSRGYTCLATHPNKGGVYSRGKAYPLLGFGECAFEDAYPQNDDIYWKVSDQTMYESFIHAYESRAADEKLFLFGVTIQNHGPYVNEYTDAATGVALNGYSRCYPQAEQYLGALNRSDAALAYLISYFENVDSPVIIVLFGDHQPGIEAELSAEVHGKSFDTLDEQMLQYEVPFVIWANYDIDAREIELTGINMLTNYLYEAAGMELPAYNRFLRDMSQVIPAMNSTGYYSSARGEFLPYSEASEEEARWLRDFDILQYNSLFDTENRSEVFFPTADE